MNDLISIIIPAYNAEPFLETTLRSVVAQTYQNIEIIVVNDGSTDQTGEIADEWARKDERIIAIRQGNQGVSAARNKGLAIAKGNYIGFVDADDEIEPDMYEFLYDNIRKYDADISHCGFELVKKDKTVQFHNTGIILVQDRVQVLQELLAGTRVEPSACTKLFKKEIIQNIRFATDIKINEDLLFNMEAFNNSQKSIFEDVVKYKYQYNPNSASRSSKTLFIGEEVYKVANRIKMLFQDEEIKDSVEKFYVAKLLTTLKSLKKHRLFKSELAKQHRAELKRNTAKNLGLRLSVLKNLLVYFPFFYDPFIYFYDMLFATNQKWK